MKDWRGQKVLQGKGAVSAKSGVVARPGNNDKSGVTGAWGLCRKWQGLRPVVKCLECQPEVLGHCPAASGSQ